MNKMLMERVRSMLSGANLEKKLSAKAVTIACYLINKSPTSTLMDKTPIEVYMSKKPSLQHLCVFGCEAYAHVSKAKQSKLDNKVVKCIFIDYDVGVKG